MNWFFSYIRFGLTFVELKDHDSGQTRLIALLLKLWFLVLAGDQQLWQWPWMITNEWMSNYISHPFSDSGHRGPCTLCKPCNHNLQIGVLIFPHKDNTPSKCVFTGIFFRGCVSERVVSSYSVSYSQSLVSGSMDSPCQVPPHRRGRINFWLPPFR